MIIIDHALLSLKFPKRLYTLNPNKMFSLHLIWLKNKKKVSTWQQFMDDIMYLIFQDVVLFSIEPPNDFFYIEKYSGRIYLRRSPSENPTVSEYTVS